MEMVFVSLRIGPVFGIRETNRVVVVGAQLCGPTKFGHTEIPAFPTAFGQASSSLGFAHALVCSWVCTLPVRSLHWGKEVSSPEH